MKVCFDYTSPSAIRWLFAERGLAFNKDYGQNFLIDGKRLALISDSMAEGLNPGDSVFEVGPGIGSLTSRIVGRGLNVTVFEIDAGFVRILGDFFSSDECEIVHGDALTEVFCREKCPDALCGNLPYNVSSVLIARVLENGVCGKFPKRMVFLVQKEVAERLSAEPATTAFSSLSLLRTMSYDCRMTGGVVSRTGFYPQPKVDSGIVVMDRRKSLTDSAAVRSSFVRLARILFAMRRKTVKNNLAGAFGKDADALLSAASVDGSRRAEQLSADDFMRLAEACAGLAAAGA